jgi:hypothetical protein
MSFGKLGRFGLVLAVPLSAAVSCTVEDKGDYTFDDNPGGEAGTGGGKGGSAGAGGTSAGKGGKGGAAGASGKGGAAGATSGGGGEAGEAPGAGAGGAPDVGGAGGAAGAGTSDGGTGGAADPCDPNPCEHGDCSVDGDGYDCDCDAGYRGTRCQTNIDDCDPNPCLNGGECDDGVDEYTCDCDGTGYVGSRCQTPTGTSCADDPCVNGTCTDVTGGGFSCDCTGTGYEGDVCDEDVNDCDADPCEHGGTCSDTGTNSYACDCRGTGYEGTNCETDIDDCASNPCVNGRCFDTGVDAFLCDCTGSGYVGETCSCNAQVLYLDDTVETNNAAVEAALEAQGLTVTRIVGGAGSSTTLVGYSGDPSASGFGAVVVSPAGNSYYGYDMPPAGQSAIVDACNNYRTGFVTTEWSGFEIGQGRYVSLAPLLLLTYGGGPSGSVLSLTATGHPIWAGTPATFTSTLKLAWGGGSAVINGGTELATCVGCGGSGINLPAAAFKEATGTNGRRVHWGHAANYSGAWQDDPNLIRTFVNSVKWATRCF